MVCKEVGVTPPQLIKQKSMDIYEHAFTNDCGRKLPWACVVNIIFAGDILGMDGKFMETGQTLLGIHNIL